MDIAQIEKPGSYRRLIANEILTLAKLSAPIVVGLVGGSAFGVIDSYMLSPVGELALASASLTNSVLIIFYSAIFGLLSPVSILAGNAYGAQRNELIDSVCRHGLFVAGIGSLVAAGAMVALLPAMAHTGQPADVIAALPIYWLAMSLSLIPYALSMVIKLLLDAIGQPWISALLTLLPVAFVIPLNWLLIYGNWGMPKLGLVGAGIATLLAQIFGYLIMRSYIAASRGFAARIEHRHVVEFLRHGLPMSLQYLAESSAIGVTGILVGLLGSAALAANQVALSLGELIYMVPFGISGAIGILVAQATGEKVYERVRAIGIASFILVMLVTLPFTVAMVVYGGKIAALFVDEPAVISILTVLLITIATVQTFDGLQSVALGALRGLLDNRWPTCITLVAYWLVAVPLSVVLGFVLDFGPAGIWCGFGIGVAFASALLIHRFMRQTKRLAGIHN